MAKVLHSTGAMIVGSAVGVMLTLASGELRAQFKPATKPHTTSPSPSQPPPSAYEQKLKDKLAFRKAVLEAMKHELAAIDGRIEAIETKAAAAKKTFDGHRHEFEMVGHGWVKIDTMLTSDHHDVVREPYLDDWIAVRDSSTTGTSTRETSKPTK